MGKCIVSLVIRVVLIGVHISVVIVWQRLVVGLVSIVNPVPSHPTKHVVVELPMVPQMMGMSPQKKCSLDAAQYSSVGIIIIGVHRRR